MRKWGSRSIFPPTCRNRFNEPGLRRESPGHVHRKAEPLFADLELEIPETVAFSTDEDAINRLRRLRDIGIAVALDDFGTGFAALYTLKQLPVTRLKIDKSFVQDVQQNRTSRAIVGAILLIGRELGIDVIAEGIETAEHSRALSGLGCEAAQGYFYGRPAPAEAMFPTAQR